jgi:hypothetical protein
MTSALQGVMSLGDQVQHKKLHSESGAQEAYRGMFLKHPVDHQIKTKTKPRYKILKS